LNINKLERIGDPMAKILPLAYYGADVLRKKAAQVELLTPEIQEFIVDLKATLETLPGVGLAAPQVHRSLRIFATRFPIEDESGESVLGPTRIFINPKLSSPSERKDTIEEGCLSIPKVRLEIERPLQITVEAMDETGNTFIETFDGYNARIVMHENDHLNGMLLIDRIDLKMRKKIDPYLKEIKAKYNTISKQ
jgi:peptide deformylase